MFFSKSSLLWAMASVMVLDLILTTLGQPDHYWEDHTQCSERNIIGIITLSTHPCCFILLYGPYLLVILFLATRTPYIVSIVTMVAALAGHVWGTAHWIPGMCIEPLGGEVEQSLFEMGYFTVAAIFALGCIVRMHEAKLIAKLLAED